MEALGRQWLRALMAAVLAATPGPWADADEAAPDRVGYAYSPESGAFLYREDHFETVEAGRLVAERVIYRTGDGERLARKRLDYAGNPYAPRFELRMTVNAYREGLRRTEQGLRAFYRPVGEERTRSALLAGADKLVADAGFDRLVADRLEALKDGQAPTFDFLVPGRLTTYPFRARRVGMAKVLGEPAVHLRLEPARFWLRWLADPIEVYYHRDSARLLRYVGPSNLRGPDGSNPRVRVEFPPDGIASGPLTPLAAERHPILTESAAKDQPR